MSTFLFKEIIIIHRLVFLYKKPWVSWVIKKDVHRDF